MNRIVTILCLMISGLFFTRVTYARTQFWEVQSIDTMKYSRDMSRGKLSPEAIDNQMQNIAALGATHVAIGTPYDKEFIPVLNRWVTSARKYNLNVWFRGNWSGWEGWFDFPKNLTRNEHFNLTRKFIIENQNLFRDGDIFSACPECENGGPGDPRFNNDVNGFRSFMVSEYQMTKNTFREIHKNVISNYTSMNGDVAKLIMDIPTTKSMDGIVTVDQYFSTPEKFMDNTLALAKSSGGKIVIGEFGAPIPNLNGNLNENDQALLIDQILVKILNEPVIIGLNYWVNTGGSTSLWNPDNNPKKVVTIMANYFSPKSDTIKIVNEYNQPLGSVQSTFFGRQYQSQQNDYISLPRIDFPYDATLKRSGYQNTTILVNPQSNLPKQIVLHKTTTNIWENLNQIFLLLFRNLKLFTGVNP
jgi:hypothetical protein